MLILTPAYGRDYRSKKAAVLDLESNKDFVIENFDSPDCGRYVNAEQITGQRVQLRFDRLRKVAIVTVPSVCPNCSQWQRKGDCLNECHARGFAESK